LKENRTETRASQLVVLGTHSVWLRPGQAFRRELYESLLLVVVDAVSFHKNTKTTVAILVERRDAIDSQELDGSERIHNYCCCNL
jgi:hypothetical protein